MDRMLNISVGSKRPMPPRLILIAAHSLLALSFFGEVAAPPEPIAVPPDPVEPEAVAEAADPTAAETSLDEALRLIEEAQQSYQQVRDYACLMVKRELLAGRLTPAHHVLLRVRKEPFSVDLCWQQPKELAGQEACYVAGKHHGKLRARAPGKLGLIGFMSLDLDDPCVKESSNHSILEAGIGALIEHYGTVWRQESRRHDLRVRLDETLYDQRSCVRVEAIHTGDCDHGLAYRTVLLFDRETHLPIRLEVYQRKDDDPHGQLIELYSYVNLRLNVGLGDEVFNH
jgi:hypothetical protein